MVACRGSIDRRPDSLPSWRRCLVERQRRDIRLGLHPLRHQRRKPPTEDCCECHLLKQIYSEVHGWHVSSSGHVRLQFSPLFVSIGIHRNAPYVYVYTNPYGCRCRSPAMKLNPPFAAAIVLTATQHSRLRNGSRMPAGVMPIEFSRRPPVGKGMKARLPLATA